MYEWCEIKFWGKKNTKKLHLHYVLNTWLQWIGQWQLQDETRNIQVLELGATYIRDLTVCQKTLLKKIKHHCSNRGNCVNTISKTKMWLILRWNCFTTIRFSGRRQCANGYCCNRVVKFVLQVGCDNGWHVVHGQWLLLTTLIAWYQLGMFTLHVIAGLQYQATINYVSHRNSFHSLAPGACGSNFGSVIFKLITPYSSLSTRFELTPGWMPCNLTNEKSILVEDWLGANSGPFY